MRGLKFGNKIAEPAIRTLADLKDLLYDPASMKDAPDTGIYYMYRDLALGRKDKETMMREHIRYDITVMPPRTIGSEYVKTVGHYHPLVPGTSLSYTELYEVLEGTAHYLLQKLEDGKVSDVILVQAGKGDKVLMPPNYGHITINPGNKELKMSNLVSDNFTSDYEPYQRMRGGAYYELTGGLRKNENYGPLPEIRVVKAKKIPELGIEKSEEIYSIVRKEPERLRFLNSPQNYGWLLGLY